MLLTYYRRPPRVYGRDIARCARFYPRRARGTASPDDTLQRVRMDLQRFHGISTNPKWTPAKKKSGLRWNLSGLSSQGSAERQP